jgi:hypothetical protein
VTKELAMKRIIISVGIVLGLGLCLSPRKLWAQAEIGSLPPCATDGDKDQDGVPDELDVEEQDSCLASSSGYEDCEYGEGDGLPDCR